ncbi:vacuolar cation/proton exchanger 2-like isoform X3 [Rhododendron vialii]|uniref:vacuolar cation/proton exchanger 2-like isoform X3 n=1 Tax=Rhododendron vialii TaxID=182163 RepID=UPI00265E0003|nr:vacuolar cation/proton exchanger 2-like isoform X3 [Rhododendron vialii]
MPGIQPRIEMESLEEHYVIEEDECLINRGPTDKRVLYLGAAPNRYYPFSLFSEDCGWKEIWNIVLSRTKVVFFSNKINLLVPCGPLAVLVDLVTGHQGSVFLLSLLGTIPLAERLGWVTEQLAFYTGPTVGGLLNATFGNATELIISIHAMKSGMIRVVQQSLLGSILSNMLLVLGSAFFSGGIVHSNKEQVFNKDESEADGSSDDKEAPKITKWESIIWLFILTASISFLSEYLVNAIEGASVALAIPVAFISVILLPIVGNAAEHASAVMFAMKDELDMSLGVAIGSSTQISMFGIPFCVVYGWVLGHPMDLNFQLFETATLFMTVLVVAFMLQEGTSNYFKGLMLLFCYLIVAASYFVHIDPESIRDKPET